MGKELRVRGRQRLGLLVALAAVLLVPITVQGATAQPMPSVTVAAPSQVADSSEEQVAADGLRTSGTLAAVVFATAGLVWLWWYLRGRRRD